MEKGLQDTSGPVSLDRQHSVQSKHAMVYTGTRLDVIHRYLRPVGESNMSLPGQNGYDSVCFNRETDGQKRKTQSERQTRSDKLTH